MTALTERVDASSNPQAGWKQQKRLKLEDDFLFLQPTPKDTSIFYKIRIAGTVVTYSSPAAICASSLPLAQYVVGGKVK